MNAYEQAKKNIARAEELAQAVKDGKRVEFRYGEGPWRFNANDDAWMFFKDIHQFEYRILEPKRRRPWTREEAERHVGWVLVSKDGKGAVISAFFCESAISGHAVDPTLEELCNHGWRVYRTDKPEDLKPCWVEE